MDSLDNVVPGPHMVDGKIVITVHGTERTTAHLPSTDPLAHAIAYVGKGGHSPAYALKFFATLGAALYHPNNGAEIERKYTAFFGNPRPLPSGSVLGGIAVSLHGRSFQEHLAGDDNFGIELLRAHEMGNDPADAFLFLAELGLRLYRIDHPMLGGRKRDEARRIFGEIEAFPDVFV